MNRRQFFRLGTAGLVTTATMSEVGIWAEFLSWIKRAPAWSFPSPIKYLDPSDHDLFNEIDAITMENVRANIIFDQLFVDTPFQSWLRKNGALKNGWMELRGGREARIPLILDAA